MAPPPSQVVSPLVSLVLRILTVLFLFISLILLTTASGTTSLDSGSTKVKFNDFKAFRYLCAAIILGLAYSLLQTAFTIFELSTSTRFDGEAFVYVDFLGDKIVSYLLATGSAACFGLTNDMKVFLEVLGIKGFANTVNAASALCLLGFLLTATLSVFSSMTLPKKP